MLALLLFAACSGAYLLYQEYGPNKMAVASVTAYNHTDVGIDDFFVNDTWGGNSYPHTGGGKSLCCVMIPAKWRPGLVANIKWHKDGDEDEVASHEVRGCFPVDLVREQGKYPPNCHEVVYPGAHSDVGGGYRPSAQGRSPLPADENAYSFTALMPCIDMHKEAIASGVPLKAVGQMVKEDARDFRPTPEAVERYNAYLKAD